MIEVPPSSEAVLTRPREDPPEDQGQLPPFKMMITPSPEKDTKLENGNAEENGLFSNGDKLVCTPRILPVSKTHSENKHERNEWITRVPTESKPDKSEWITRAPAEKRRAEDDWTTKKSIESKEKNGNYPSSKTGFSGENSSVPKPKSEDSPSGEVKSDKPYKIPKLDVSPSGEMKSPYKIPKLGGSPSGEINGDKPYKIPKVGVNPPGEMRSEKPYKIPKVEGSLSGEMKNDKPYKIPKEASPPGEMKSPYKIPKLGGSPSGEDKIDKPVYKPRCEDSQPVEKTVKPSYKPRCEASLPGEKTVKSDKQKSPTKKNYTPLDSDSEDSESENLSIGKNNDKPAYKPRCEASLPGEKTDKPEYKPRCAASLPGEKSSNPAYKPRCEASLPGENKSERSSSKNINYTPLDSEGDESETEDQAKSDDSDEDMDSNGEIRSLFYKEPLKAYLPTELILEPTPDNFPKDVEPMTFYPTYEEFKDLKKYMAYIESCGAVAAGICKIVPPKEWIPRKQGYNPGDIDVELDHPVQQNISVNEVDGAFKTLSDRSIPHFTPEEYVRLATSEKYMTPSHNSYEELEELYWKQNLDDKLQAPIYGADVCDSVTDKEQKYFNIRKLDSLLTAVLDEQIPGVNLPYLYFGMWKATFSWHIEDMDLYAVNFLHFGAPKTWYCVPPQYGYKLEQVAQKLFPDMAKTCFNLMRHKAVMIGPEILRANGVKVNKMVQEERNIMVVFPHAYHSGFNHGYNVAESTNFAIDRWVEYGKRFRDCVCRGNDDEVSIDMDPFVKEVQPERYRDWVKGRDFALHPEDPWYIRRCLQDAVKRYEMEDITFEEFNRLKKELKRMRKIPNWFKERFVLDYDDQIFIELPESNIDMTDSDEIKVSTSPRVKAAKRNLLERMEESNGKICEIKLKKLRRTVTDIYMTEMKAYEDMQEEMRREKEERMKRCAEGKRSNALGAGAARGVGFQGAITDDLLEKKSRVVCRAKKNHRFKACAKCTGCRRTNCGECMYCLDMPRFGGLGVIKQKCETRVCVNPIITTCEHCVWTI